MGRRLDQPCERRRDVAIEVLSEKAVVVGAKLDHHIQKITDAFWARSRTRARVMAPSVVDCMSLSQMCSANGLWKQRSVKAVIINFQHETARNSRA